MDYIGATPMQNPIMGLLAERLKQAQEFAAKPFGYSNPPAEMLMNLLGVPAVQQTAERIAYGEPLTTGRGMTTQIRPEAVEAALTVAPTAGLLGKTAERGAMAAGRAGERYAEKVVPQIMERGGLPAQLLGDLSQGSIRPIDVWHGSPHGPFPKFDSSKIGTGEGAQAFGHGLYTGEARGTGEEYRKALTGNQFGDKLVPTVDGIPSDTPTLRNLIRNGQSPEDFIASMQNKLKSQETALKNASKEEILPGVSDYDMAEMALGETKKLIDEAKGYVGKEIKAEPIGYLYKVDLPDEAIANMLDWDKPLSKQPKNVQDYFYSHPKVQEYVNNQNAERLRLNEQYPGRLSNPALKNIVNKEITADSLKGSKLYELATTGYSIQDEKIPVEMMRQAGIPGNRYLDQGSRDIGEGTSNFVVFPGNEDLLKIKEINDKPYEQWFPKTNLLETAEPKAAQGLLDTSYRGSHTAPGPDFGAPLHDLTGGGQMYPADVYSSKAVQYYGAGEPYDAKAFSIAQSFKDKPNATVTIYRAVPKEKSNADKLADLDRQMSAYMRRGVLPQDANTSNGSQWYDWAYGERERLRNLPDEPAQAIGSINSGDWVTLTREYAKDHGESALKGQYKIISKKVKAKDLWTNADSIHEFGYHPQ